MGQPKSQILVWFGQPEKSQSGKKGEVLTFRQVREIRGNGRRRPMPTIEEKDFVYKIVEVYSFSFDKRNVVCSWKKEIL